MAHRDRIDAKLIAQPFPRCLKSGRQVRYGVVGVGPIGQNPPIRGGGAQMRPRPDPVDLAFKLPSQPLALIDFEHLKLDA